MTTKRSWSWALLSSFVVLAALQGCGDDEGGNDKPPTTVKPTGGTSGTGNEAGSDAQGGSPDGGGTKNTGGTGNTGNTGNTNAGGSDAPVGGNGAGGAPPEPACDLPELGEDGCFNCPVKGEQEQWLNRCLETDCVPFDNARVTQINADGSLPPLPN
ncbi:MAG: hypothetical protein K0R38_5334 [Polyangiaceae bacterium]|jgi:hypothetical protein|nr:hypothetical protein [Polyangiaceae bacterium]